MEPITHDGLTIRLATKDDRKDFMRLWSAFLKEEYELGGEWVYSDHNVREFLSLFNAYTIGMLRGIATLGFDGDTAVGCNLIGENFQGGMNIETRRGYSCTVWGNYVHPEYRRRGLSYAMLAYPEDPLREMGFRGGYSSTKYEHVSEEVAFNYGVEKTMVCFYFDLYKDQK